MQSGFREGWPQAGVVDPLPCAYLCALCGKKDFLGVSSIAGESGRIDFLDDMRLKLPGETYRVHRVVQGDVAHDYPVVDHQGHRAEGIALDMPYPRVTAGRVSLNPCEYGNKDNIRK